MAWGILRHRLIAIAAGALLAACTQTSRVDDNLSTASLAQTKKAVAVMRVGAASPTCVNVAVLLGVREGDGYRRHQGITVANVRSITEPAVAEVELDPGEYHVLAYRCQSAGGTVKQVDDNAGPGGQLYRTSYASFTLQAGEIVNVGYLRLVAWRHRQQRDGPAGGDGDRDYRLAAQRARSLQGQAPPHLRADDDAADAGHAAGGGGAGAAGVRAAQGAAGRRQGAAAAACLSAAGKVGAQGRRSCQVGRQFVSPRGIPFSSRSRSTAMASRPPADCRDMTEVRTEIDRVDNALVDLIAERFGYVERAWQLKLEARQEANVPWRNQQVFDKVRARAGEKGLPPDLVEALWRQMVGWFIQYEEEKLRHKIEGQKRT